METNNDCTSLIDQNVGRKDNEPNSFSVQHQCVKISNKVEFLSRNNIMITKIDQSERSTHQKFLTFAKTGILKKFNTRKKLL